MADDTAISWARHTFNLWWGCDEPGADPDTDFVEGTLRAPECLNCYARAWDHRMGGSHWGPGPRKFASERYWSKPVQWNAAAQREGRRASVFVQSMGDWAELHPDPVVNARMDEARGRLWRLIQATPWLDWLLLTKRVDRLPALLPWVATRADWASVGVQSEMTSGTPWPNVWIGTSCGARSSLWRVQRLRQVPAVRRFVSAEPLTEHISGEDWDRVLRWEAPGQTPSGRIPSIHWLIVGDESEHPKKRRPAQLDWIRTAREAALRHGVVFHFKQWNGPATPAIHASSRQLKGKIHLPVLDGKVWDGIPSSVVDRNS